MKPFQVIVLIVFGCLAAVGLFLFATFSGFNRTAVEIGPVVIWGTLPESVVYAGIDALTQTNEEYGQVTYVQIEPNAFDAQFAEALASGSGPDLVIISQEQILAQQNKLSPIPYTSISERSFLNTYTPIHELFMTAEGFYGMPLAVDPLVLYYNRSLLAADGIASPPTNWEAVTGLAERLTKRQSNQTIDKSAIAFGEYQNVTNARAVISLLLLQSGTPITQNVAGRVRSVIDTGTGTTGTSPAVSAMNFYTQFANPVKTVYSWNRSLPSSRQAFLAGDLAFYVGFASERAFLSEANPNLDFDMAPIPQPATVTSGKTYGMAYAVAITRTSPNFAGAFQTAIALAFPDPMRATVERAGMAPARRDMLTSYPDRYAEIYYPQALTSTAWLSPAPLATDSVFSAMIENITTGRRDVTSALMGAHQSLSASLP